MNEELIAKAREAKSPEELLKLAKEAGISDITEENAGAYFELISSKGELSDDELSNAAGACKNGGRRVVTISLDCVGYSKFENRHFWKCDKCGKLDTDDKCYHDYDWGFRFGHKDQCGTCGWCHYEKGLWLCYNPDANKL